MERVAYAILLTLAALWLAGIVAGLVAVLPYGVVGLLLILAVGLLFVKVLRERMANADDDHYSRHVDQ